MNKQRFVEPRYLNPDGPKDAAQPSVRCSPVYDSHNMEEPPCPSTDVAVSMCRRPRECYSAMRKNELTSLAATGVDLETVMLRKRVRLRENVI